MILHVEMSVADIAVGRKVLPVPLGQGQGVEWGRKQWIEADLVLEPCSVGEESGGVKESNQAGRPVKWTQMLSPS